MLETMILQTVRLKGGVTPEVAAAAAQVAVERVDAELDRLRAAGLVKGDARIRITPDGKSRLVELVEQEREATDGAALTTAYEDFDAHNSKLKAIITAWQLREGEPNDHADADYDAQVIRQLAELHERFLPLVHRIAELAPRLEPYSQRFTNALKQAESGDHAFVARPILDSYHTVWFEFHEELINLLGLSRAAEAAAGRAD